MRASAALHIPVASIFFPMLGVQAVGLVFVFTAAWWLGIREERRLGAVGPVPGNDAEAIPKEQLKELPRHFFLNLLLTLVVLGTMLSGKVDPVVAFLLGTIVALSLNESGSKAQQARIAAHAPAAILMASILFAAGAFTGIMKGTGMLNAMAAAAVHHLPAHGMRFLPVTLGVISMPLSLVFDPDSFYFGVLPVLAQAAGAFGIPAVTVAQSALLGMHTTGFPVSPLTPATYLVVGLSEITLAQHQRFTIPYLFAASLLMTLAAIAFRVIPL